MTRFALTLLLALTVPLAAQTAENGKSGDQSVIAHRPPPGMCRIWIDGVPAERQPAPTDCATAIRRRPSNARVIFGEELRPPRGQVQAPRLVEQPPKPVEPAPNVTQGNEPKPNDPKAGEPRTVDPNTNQPRPRVQRPPPRMPPRQVPKPHKPSGPPMSHIRIH